MKIKLVGGPADGCIIEAVGEEIVEVPVVRPESIVISEFPSVTVDARTGWPIYDDVTVVRYRVDCVRGLGIYEESEKSFPGV